MLEERNGNLVYRSFGGVKLGKRKMELEIPKKVQKIKKKRYLCLADEGDHKNPQTMYEYVDDIMKDLFVEENENLVKRNYMKNQRDISPDMRRILIGWLIECHHKFKLKPSSLHLTINLIDRFLSSDTVRKDELQLVGSSCMLIASKYEEIYAPEIRDFIYVSDRAFTEPDVLKMEKRICTALNFTFTVPTPLHFARRFIKIAEGDSTLKFLVHYLMELTFFHYEFVTYKPSVIATSALYLALKMTRGCRWSEHYVHQTTYSSQTIRPCVNLLYDVMINPGNQEDPVRKKYASSKYEKVANLHLRN